ncbi:D-lactate ferricytochrome c oxidoreductase, partial [Dimargaris xerosporica]
MSWNNTPTWQLQADRRICALYVALQSTHQVDASDIAFFRQTLSPTQVLTSNGSSGCEGQRSTTKDDLTPYCTDYTGAYQGQSPVVLLPSSTAQVSQILGYCHQQHLAVVPQGGNTGVVGGSVSVYDEIVLSLSRLNQIRTFDPISGALVCDAGCILQSLDTFLAPYQRRMPLDLGAKGTCQIGGNVATHAGGIHFIKFGPLRGSILGLEVVLSDGRIVNALSTAQKDNTGYNISQWFVGSEGTLGVITGVAIQTHTRAL